MHRLLVSLLLVGICSWLDAQNQFIVKFNSSEPVPGTQNIVPEYLWQTISKSKRLYKLITSHSLEEVRAIPGVLHAYPDALLEKRETVPDDPQFADQPSLEKIESSKAWDYTKGGTNALGDKIVIAVIDEGFDISHIDFQGNLWANPGEIPNDGIDNDQNGFTDDYYGVNLQSKNDQHNAKQHGTSVAGIIGAKGNNAIGIAGINWNTQLMLISIPNLTISDLFIGYEYVLDQRRKYNLSNGQEGAYVVAFNQSLGVTGRTPDEFPDWCPYFDEMLDAGILFINATTNSEWDVDTQYDMPASCPSQGLITVTNTNLADMRVTSGYGQTTIDLAAPGDGSYSLGINNEYRDFTGTSAASPHVTGVVGLLFSYPCTEFAQYLKSNPKEGAIIIRDYLLGGVDIVPSLAEETVTGGRLNALNPMRTIQEEWCTEVLGDELGIRQVFLNQNDRTLRIDLVRKDAEPLEYLICNTLGQVMYHEKLTNPVQNVIFLDHLPGNITYGNVYFICLRQGKTIVATKLIYL